MKLGMPTLIELDTLADCARLCQELGLDFIELNMNMPQYQCDQLDPAQLRQLADQFGIFFTLHLDENLNACDFNSEVRRAYINTTLAAIGTAINANMPIINMHVNMGVHFKLPDGPVFLFEKYKPLYLQRLINFRELCTQAISTAPLALCVENTNGFPKFACEGIELLLQSSAFDLTMDIGHNHAVGCVDEPFILARPERLRHMHIHDSIGPKCHLPLGTGEIDIAKWIALARKLDCSCVLETKSVTGLRQTVSTLRRDYAL